MFRYYLWLAVRSLRRNPVLTALMVIAIGLGIGASMTTLTMFRAMSGDPIPDKSSRLFAPQIDNWGPDHREKAGEPDQVQLSYSDARALMEAHRGLRQTAMYATAFALTPADPQMRPFHATGRAAYADFFPMFEAPFLWGAPWGKAEDEDRADVVVISKSLNDKLFGGINSVGKTLHLEQRDYRIVGVLDHWMPQPRVYDVVNNTFGDTEDVFLPFTTAIEQQLAFHGNNSCVVASSSGWDGHLHSECIWTQFWVELASAEDAAGYRRFLDDYAAEQQRNGRFHWAPLTRLSNVAQWMKLNHVVSDESRIMVAVSFGFLFVCLVNAVGLMLAKFMSRAGETGVRRALGAPRRAIFLQCLVETGVIGVAGAFLGLALTALGLVGMRASFSEDLVHLLQLDPTDVVLAVLLAVSSALLAGLYPNWRATQVQPAWQLKSN
ncbi:MAG: ABC transporter permease [Nevskia sp.]|nr:ABC transporter permease [Nevskia sp.]